MRRGIRLTLHGISDLPVTRQIARTASFDCHVSSAPKPRTSTLDPERIDPSGDAIVTVEKP
jgi:hypothetical protein